MAVYAYCDQNCKYETMTKEEILTAIAQMERNGNVEDLDKGFITTVKTINGRGLKFFVGTQAEYDSLSKTQKDGVFALITNDATKDGLLKAIADLQEEQSNINNTFAAITTGAFAIPEAKHAVNADVAGEAWTMVKNDLVRDTTNGGFFVTEAGVHLVTAVKNVSDVAARRLVKTEMIVITDIGMPAVGGSGTFAKYGSYDAGDGFNPSKFRLNIFNAAVDEGYVLTRATRIMYL